MIRGLVFTNGCFDVLHVAHVRFLEKSKRLGTALVVGLNSDRVVSLIKGPGRPVHNQNYRMEILRALRCVDGVRIFDELVPVELMRELQPEFYTKGDRHSPSAGREIECLREFNGKLIVIPEDEGISTTKIIERIRQ